MKMSKRTQVYVIDEARVIIYAGGEIDVCTKKGIEYCPDFNDFERWYPELAEAVYADQIEMSEDAQLEIQKELGVNV